MAETPYLDAVISAGEGAIPTTELWEEIRNIVSEVSSMGQRGSVTLAGSTGAVVTIPNDIGSIEYDVFWSLEKTSAAGAVGEITIKKVSGTSFTVYNSGSDKVTSLRWWVVPR